MVANISAHKKGMDENWEEFSDWAARGQAIKDRLLKLVDEDAIAFEEVLNAMKLPSATPDETAQRKRSVMTATKKAIEVPCLVMQAAMESMEILKKMAEKGLKSSVSDAGVGALMAYASIKGAYLNVRINCNSLEDKTYAEKVISEAKKDLESADLLEKEISAIVENKMS
jgi:glutamate formiminotransferase/formiminotetrahydrofolate cyclodeaminase